MDDERKRAVETDEEPILAIHNHLGNSYVPPLYRIGNGMGKEQKTFREFPDSYFEMLERFETSSSDQVFKGTYRELSSLRHNLYRFFKAIQREIDEGRSDEYVLTLLKLKRNISISLLPSRAKAEEETTLRIHVETLTRVLKGE